MNIKRVLKRHQHWLNKDCIGWKYMCANLSGADLSCANLSCVNLKYANLSGAYLKYANLSDANLKFANLSCANLKYADLSGANLKYANLSGANLSGADNIPYIPMICPEEGEFIGWKRANNKIVKLLITEDSLRSSACGRNCRCSKAIVLGIYNLDGTEADKKTVKSNYDQTFVYTLGETVEVKNFNTNRWNECAAGIHFFINRQEAINYLKNIVIDASIL